MAAGRLSVEGYDFRWFFLCQYFYLGVCFYMNTKTTVKSEEGLQVASVNWANLIVPTDYISEISGLNSAVFKVSPLERGYGTTFGNSIRRILLSSMRGFAITSVKFDGITHEFTTISGVREDVTDIILNLKKVVILYDPTSSDPDFKCEARIDAVGPCVVTAGMISGVDVVNRDHVICNIDKEGKFSATLRIGAGVGYVPSSENEDDSLPVGTIAIDSLFSPVRSVSFYVDNSRVGSDTEYDRLSLTIETNGAITPQLALAIAAKVMQIQLDSFINFTIKKSYDAVDAEVLQFDYHLLRKLEDVELSVRSQNCLKNDNIIYIGDLIVKTESEMLKTPNFGRKSLNEIKDLLHSYGLRFGMIIPEWPPENIAELAKQYEDLLG